MSARVYFMKVVNGWKSGAKFIRKMNSENGQVYSIYSVCILQFSCFTEYNRMQSKHKLVNIVDENLTD